MDSFQHHSSNFDDTLYSNTATGSGFSCFARPNKIVKSNSRNGSPRSRGRRRTTTSAASTGSRTRSVVDQLRSSPQSSLQLPGSQSTSRSRPVSWHPHSINHSNWAVFPTQDMSLTQNFTTTQVHGLITPVSYPAINEPQIQELITPLDEYPSHDFTYSSFSQTTPDCTWLSPFQGKGENLSLEMCYGSGFPQQEWQFNPDPSPVVVQTAPSSPDYPPVQAIGLDNLTLDTGKLEADDDNMELVGMGLYDSPADVQSSSLFFGTTTTERKSLKLEESFVPEERDEGEDGEDGEDEDDDQLEDEDPTQSEPDNDYTLDLGDRNSYHSQSIANHLTFQIDSNTESLASTYLATLNQLNSAYYPSSSSYSGYGVI